MWSLPKQIPATLCLLVSLCRWFCYVVPGEDVEWKCCLWVVLCNTPLQKAMVLNNHDILFSRFCTDLGSLTARSAGSWVSLSLWPYFLKEVRWGFFMWWQKYSKRLSPRTQVLIKSQLGSHVPMSPWPQLVTRPRLESTWNGDYAGCGHWRRDSLGFLLYKPTTDANMWLKLAQWKGVSYNG